MPNPFRIVVCGCLGAARDTIAKEVIDLSDTNRPRRLAFVGGGRAAKAVLQLLESIHQESGAPQVEVLAVADIDPEAPGMVLARAKGIRTLEDYRDLLALDGLEAVIELTGRDDIRRALTLATPPGVSLIDHEAVLLFWTIFQSQESRIKVIRRDLHAKRLAAVSEMSTYIAHEIRNPLMAIGGFAQSLISMDCLKDDNCLRRARVIVEEARRLEDVLRNIWDLTRPLTIAPREADLNQIVIQVIEMCREELSAAGVEVEMHLDPDLGPASLDSHLVRQACLNVIKNGWEAMPRGGSLRISTERTWEYVTFLCQDQGPGITAEVMTQIFNPFFTTKEGAMGLGLAMTRKIAEDHGGEIRIRNQEEGGSAVALTFPLSPA